MPESVKTLLDVGCSWRDPILVAAALFRGVHRISSSHHHPHSDRADRIRDVRRPHGDNAFRDAKVPGPQSTGFAPPQLYSARPGGHSFPRRPMHRFATMTPNQSLELTAARRASTFQITKTVSVRARLALGGGSSAPSR